MMKYPILPTRFENINVKNKEVLKSFILKNNKAINHIRKMFINMESSNSGAFLLLKGESGTGKTTFINTLSFFLDKQGITIEPVENNKNDIQYFFNKCKEVRFGYRIIVLENREFASQVKTSELEKTIVAINKFIRSPEGKNTIIVWPCNGEEWVKDIIYFSSQIGGSSLFRSDTIFELEGPNETNYYEILKKTFHILNNQDIEEEYGLTKEEAERIIAHLETRTIGSFLELVRERLINNIIKIDNSFNDYNYESFKLWILVIAKNNPLEDIAFLTRGNNANIDIQRLVSSTNGNITIKTKQNLPILSLLAKELDCRILYIPYEVATKAITSTSNIELKELLTQFSVNTHNSNIKRTELLKSSLAQAITAQYIKYNERPVRKENIQLSNEFSGILKITENNDSIVNNEIGQILKEQGLIYTARTEEPFGLDFNIRTDLLCGVQGDYLRLEMMWRTQSTRAQIANYTLQKLLNYGSALGIID